MPFVKHRDYWDIRLVNDFVILRFDIRNDVEHDDNEKVGLESKVFRSKISGNP